MALLTCKDCNQQFSSDAKRCPHCGAKKVVKKIGPSFKSVIVGFLLIGGVGLMIQPSLPKVLAPAQRTSEENTMLGAKLMCQELVKQSLHDPDSAELDNVNKFPAEKQKDGTYHVQVFLRGRNGFNAIRRFYVDCKLVNKNGRLVPRLKEID